MRVYNLDLEPWKVKVHRWLCGARKSNLKGMLMGLILVIIIWRLWIASMEDKRATSNMVWATIRFWIF